MKIFSVILIFTLTMNAVRANDIDKLKTKEDVQKFLVQHVDTAWAEYDFFGVTDTMDNTPYAKGKFLTLDLNLDGLTDLLINSTYFFAVTDSGNGHYAPHFIDKGAFMSDKRTLKGIAYKDKIPLIIIGNYSEYRFMKTDTTKTDTLIFKFGGFYEYNPTPDNFDIQEIGFSTSPCFGTCPVFELLIKGDRTAKFNAKYYNDKKGMFKATVDSASFTNLVTTINYIKLTSLKDDYSVNWTDDQTITLEIKFNNGQVKNISDYGGIGTFGLEHLYDQLFALRKTQKWK